MFWLYVQYLMFTFNFDDMVRVTFYLFFPRERVSHHSGIGLQRGLNRTKFMACGNPYSLQKCKSTNTNISVFFLIKQNHRGNLHLT